MALDVSIFLQLQSNNKINSSQESNNLNSQDGNNNLFESLFAKINNKIPDENVVNDVQENNNLNLIQINNNNLISGSVLDVIIPDENISNIAPEELTQENNEQNINIDFKNNLLGSIKKFLADSGKSQDEINNIESKLMI